MMKKRRKFKTNEKIALVVLALLMVIVIGAGAYIIVNNVNEANREATNTTHTTVKIETTAVPETTAENPATEKYATKSSAKNPGKTSSVSKNNSNNTPSKNTNTSNPAKTKSSKTKSKTSSKKPPVKNNSGKISIVTPEKNKSHKSKDKCIINGTTCYVGDTISVTLNLKSAKILENYQGHTKFDSGFLTCKSVKANTGIANDKGDTIYYNASVISGMDFTYTGTVYTAKFTVNKPGSTTITNTFELLTDINDKDVSPSSITDTINIFG